jgi:ABC-type molybdenum transport system ATPase subunit/photorepair protein PhrA
VLDLKSWAGALLDHLVLAGPNGCGKTTILEVLLALGPYRPIRSIAAAFDQRSLTGRLRSDRLCGRAVRHPRSR